MAFFTPWQFSPGANYYFRSCHYQHNGFPFHFYVVWYYNHPYHRNYYYCYYPMTPAAGYYWCRCMSRVAPNYDPNLFSILDPFHRYQDLEMCIQYFPGFSTMHATYPPDFAEGNNLDNLPSDLPPGL
jgi:hypothetical protein